MQTLAVSYFLQMAAILLACRVVFGMMPLRRDQPFQLPAANPAAPDILLR